VIVLETLLAGINWDDESHEIRAVVNSIFVSLFIGSITYPEYRSYLCRWHTSIITYGYKLININHV